MKIVTGLVLASLFAMAPRTLESGVDAERVRSALGGFEARSKDARVVDVPAVHISASQSVGSERELIRAGAPNRLVLIPKERCQPGKPYDVLVHFHGVPVTVEPIVARSGLNAVVVVINLGLFSGPYEEQFQQRGALDNLLTSVARTVDNACGVHTGGARRVALSSWSAGYGATHRILVHPEDAARVDAVLLADGLHVGYVSRKVNPLAMQVFADYAEAAARGEKLLAITHSEIAPGRYASTRETAEYLVRAAGLMPTALDELGPRADMRLISSTDKADFHVRGFAGMTARDHCQHLYGIGQTLWPLLRARWAAHGE